MLESFINGVPTQTFDLDLNTFVGKLHIGNVIGYNCSVNISLTHDDVYRRNIDCRIDGVVGSQSDDDRSYVTITEHDESLTDPKTGKGKRKEFTMTLSIKDKDEILNTL